MLEALLEQEQKGPYWSLRSLATVLNCRFGISLTKQSLDERFNDALVSYFKQVLTELLPKVLVSDSRISCSHFGRILLKDSTSFQLPAHLADLYPGSGGSGSKAGIRIQFEYNLLNSEVTDLSIHPFNVQDKADALACIGNMLPNDLIIRDLGYVTVDILRNIAQQGAYYISRLPTGTNVYERDPSSGEIRKIDFDKLYRSIKRKGIKSCWKTVLLGDKEKQELRLWIEVVPEEIYAERMRKFNKEANKKGRKLSKTKTLRARFNLFVTNLEENILPDDLIRTVYRARWQIELVFKSWKSYANLAKVKSMKAHRLEALLYLRLIWVTLTGKITREIILWAYTKTSRRLSYLKLAEALTKNFHYLHQMSEQQENVTKSRLDAFLNHLFKACLHEKRKGKISKYQVWEKLFQLPGNQLNNT